MDANSVRRKVHCSQCWITGIAVESLEVELGV
jgi:hypothetical protein